MTTKLLITAKHQRDYRPREWLDVWWDAPAYRQKQITCCPISTALKEKGYKNVFVSKNGVECDDVEYPITEQIKEFIERADNSELVDATASVEIELGEPQPLNKSIAVNKCYQCGKFYSLKGLIAYYGYLHTMSNYADETCICAKCNDGCSDTPER